jgi:hypothetical protein
MGCKLLGGTYAIFLQLFIATSALASLIYKREYLDKEPKRPYNIWLMDVSKQAIAESTLHVYNVAFGILVSAGMENDASDECAFYLMNEVLDTVIGTFFVWMGMEFFQYLGRKYKVKELENTGFYGDPPEVNHYLLQLLTFMVSNLVGKTLITVICLSDPSSVQAIGGFIFNELGLSDEVELTLVMLVFPLLFAVTQMWIIDFFLGYDAEAALQDSFHYRALSDSDRGSQDDDYFHPLSMRRASKSSI